MKSEELKEILHKHQLWLNDEEGGERAHLRSADLRGANLRGVNLRSADLTYASLEYADLSNADLTEVELMGSTLGRTDFRGANLERADIRYANAHYADFTGSNLRGVQFRHTNLSGASLSGATTIRTNFSEAILEDTRMDYIPFACPSDGSFVAWKKVNKKLIKLQIPEDARRCSATSTKCRADKALVLAIYESDGVTESIETEVVNNNYASCVYKIGEMVYPDRFDDNRWNECSHGIHFFTNKREAINYNN